MIDPTLLGLTPATQRRPIPVIDGRVRCSRLHDVAVERCLECPYLARLERDAGSRRVVVCLAPMRGRDHAIE